MNKKIEILNSQILEFERAIKFLGNSKNFHDPTLKDKAYRYDTIARLSQRLERLYKIRYQAFYEHLHSETGKALIQDSFRDIPSVTKEGDFHKISIPGKPPIYTGDAGLEEFNKHLRKAAEDPLTMADWDSAEDLTNNQIKINDRGAETSTNDEAL